MKELEARVESLQGESLWLQIPIYAGACEGQLSVQGLIWRELLSLHHDPYVMHWQHCYAM